MPRLPMGAPHPGVFNGGAAEFEIAASPPKASSGLLPEEEGGRGCRTLFYPIYIRRNLTYDFVKPNIGAMSSL